MTIFLRHIDDVRRGSPSCYVAFNESLQFAGDALQSLAFEILSKKSHEEVSSKIYLDWVNFLASSIGLKGVAEGQYLDLSINGGNVEISRLEEIYDLKLLILIKPCIILPSNVEKHYDNKKAMKIFKFGTLLGISFQIKDDLLGYTSSSKY